MELTVKISTNNAAFEVEPEDEVARIVWGIAHRIGEGYREGTCIDFNGNNVGYWEAKW